MNNARMWVLVDKKDEIMPWAGARATRKQLIAEANKGCISAVDHERLETDRARWSLARQYGYRIVAVDVIPHLQGNTRAQR